MLKAIAMYLFLGLFSSWDRWSYWKSHGVKAVGMIRGIKDTYVEYGWFKMVKYTIYTHIVEVKYKGKSYFVDMEEIVYKNEESRYKTNQKLTVFFDEYGSPGVADYEYIMNTPIRWILCILILIAVLIVCFILLIPIINLLYMSE